MFLLQSAMNAARLIAAQPGLTLSDPIVAILRGILAFHEQVPGGLYIVLAVASGLIMAGAVLALARSPLSGVSARTEEDQRGGQDLRSRPSQRGGEHRAAAGSGKRPPGQAGRPRAPGTGGTARDAGRRPAGRAARHDIRRIRGFALEAVGGPARGRFVLVLAAVLGLSGGRHRDDLGHRRQSRTGLSCREHPDRDPAVGGGLVGAVFTIPVGILTDRTRRTRLLAGSILMWAAATVLSRAATFYTWLLVARVVLGAVTATTGPTVASLTGDFLPAADRGQIDGLILSRDLLGSGIGYVVSGDLSSLTSGGSRSGGWRFPAWLWPGWCGGTSPFRASTSRGSSARASSPVRSRLSASTTRTSRRQW
jgi:hypothetical protein